MSLTLSFNPIWSMVDLNGLQLDDTYYLFTLQNEIPYLFQPIWQDPDMNVSWSDPIQFLSNGTLPYNMYWDNTLVYRLEIRQGNTQSAPLIYLIENYIPEGGNDEPVGVGGTTDNQITNPQFANVSFPLVNTPQLQITTATTTDIAPGWQIVTVGTGSLSVNQLGFSGTSDLDSVGNPPFAISIANSGFSGVTLRQQFSANGALWTSQAVSFTAAMYASTDTTVNIALDYSDGSSQSILSADVTAAYTTFSNAVMLFQSTNPDVSPDAYTNLDMSWVGNVTVNITNVQLNGQPIPEILQYEQTTVERQIDQEFHYYLPQLEYKPISSYAIGWDFKYNPCQELGTTIAVSGLSANKARYIADQTIAFESVGNVLSYTVSNQGLSFTTGTTTQFALIQYLDATTAFELLSAPSLAVQINGVATNVSGYVSLYWSTAGTLPSVPIASNNTVFFSTLTAGIPTTLASNWNIVSNPYGIVVGGVQSSCVPFALNGTSSMTGWAPPSISFTGATYFAIVVSFEAIPITATSYIQYVTLNSGYIATPPAAMNEAQTLEALQYYYETSYNPSVVPGTSSNASVIARIQTVGSNGGHTNAYPATFGWEFNAVKRGIPIINFYAEDGTIADVTAWAAQTHATATSTDAAISGNWGVNSSYKAVSASPISANVISADTTGAPTLGSEAWIAFHYTADARFGQV